MEDIYFDVREWTWLKKRFNKDMVSMDELLDEMETLILDVDRLEEELHDLQQDLEDNYRPIPREEQYD